jgi:hypothetical protein
MHFLNDVFTGAGHWIRSHLFAISMAWVATLFVIFGGDLNRLVKRIFARFHFLVRLAAFILLCSFGYSAATMVAAKLLNHFLAELSLKTLVPVVAGLFMAIGILAERRSKL